MYEGGQSDHQLFRISMAIIFFMIVSGFSLGVSSK